MTFILVIRQSDGSSTSYTVLSILDYMIFLSLNDKSIPSSFYHYHQIRRYRQLRRNLRENTRTRETYYSSMSIVNVDMFVNLFVPADQTRY